MAKNSKGSNKKPQARGAQRDPAPPRVTPESATRFDPSGEDHIKWLAERYMELTVLSDAKAGFMIAIHGAMAAATFEGMNTISAVGPSLESLHLLRPFALLAIVYLAAGSASVGFALGALRPRRVGGLAGLPVFYFQKVANDDSIVRAREGKDKDTRPGSEDGEDRASSAVGNAWLKRLREASDGVAIDELAANTAAMAHTIDIKIDRTLRAVCCLYVAGAAWILGGAIVGYCLFTDAISTSAETPPPCRPASVPWLEPGSGSPLLDSATP